MASMDVPASAVAAADDSAAPATPAAAVTAAGNSASAPAPAAAAAVSAHEAQRFLLQHKEKLTMNQYW